MAGSPCRCLPGLFSELQIPCPPNPLMGCRQSPGLAAQPPLESQKRWHLHGSCHWAARHTKESLETPAAWSFGAQRSQGLQGAGWAADGFSRASPRNLWKAQTLGGLGLSDLSRCLPRGHWAAEGGQSLPLWVLSPCSESAPALSGRRQANGIGGDAIPRGPEAQGCVGKISDRQLRGALGEPLEPGSRSPLHQRHLGL